MSIQVKPFALHPARIARPLGPPRVFDIVTPPTKMTPPILKMLRVHPIQITDDHQACAVLLGHRLVTAGATTRIIRMKQAGDKITGLLDNVHTQPLVQE